MTQPKFHHHAYVDIGGKFIKVMKTDSLFAVDIVHRKGKIVEMKRICFPDRQDLETIRESRELVTYLCVEDATPIEDWISFENELNNPPADRGA